MIKTTVKTAAGETLVTYRTAGSINLIVSATVNGVSVRDLLTEADVDAIEAAMAAQPAQAAAVQPAPVKPAYSSGNSLSADAEAIICAARSFCAEVAATIDANYRRVCPSMVAAGVLDSARIEIGRRYAKIIRTEKRDGKPHDLGAFGFIDLTTGDILKAASWAKPAPHARGNVLDIDGRRNSYTHYGINYR